MPWKRFRLTRRFAHSRLKAIEKHGLAERIAGMESDPVLGFIGAPEPKRFIVFGRFIVSADYWSTFTRDMRPDHRIHSLWMSASTSAGRLYLEWLVALLFHFVKGFSIEIAARADVILVQRNVRLFYPDRGLTAKVARVGKENRVRGEVAHRQRIEALFERIPTVAIRAVDSRHMLWLIEDLIQGRPATNADEEILLSALCPNLAAYYEAGWSETKRVAETPIGEAIRRRSESSVTSDGVDEVQEMLDGFLDKYVMMAIGHGDLRLHNIVMSREGQVYLIDWERSHSMPIVQDILDLACAFPRIERFWDDWVSSFDSRDRPLLRPNDLLLVRRNASLSKA